MRRDLQISRTRSDKLIFKAPVLFPLALGAEAERNGMSMPTHDLSSRHFQRKISEFCEVRIAPIFSKRVLENVRPYLISLIICRKRPPILNGRLDWTAIGEACGIESEMTAELRKHLRPTGCDHPLAEGATRR